jgi:hypothetical protein
MSDFFDEVSLSPAESKLISDSESDDFRPPHQAPSASPVSTLGIGDYAQCKESTLRPGYECMDDHDKYLWAERPGAPLLTFHKCLKRMRLQFVFAGSIVSWPPL